MSRIRKNTLHVTLADGSSDKERIATATGIGQMAPQSALYTQHPEVKAAVDNAVLLAGYLKTQGDSAQNAQLNLDSFRGMLGKTRIKYGRAIGVLRTVLEQLATTTEEVAGLGLVGRIGATAPSPLLPPTGVKVMLGTKHGQFRVVAESTVKGPFGAQISADPIGAATWVDLPGTGKRRLITGHPTGTLLWVRFRLQRHGAASDWCTPVPVTVP